MLIQKLKERFFSNAYILTAVITLSPFSPDFIIDGYMLLEGSLSSCYTNFFCTSTSNQKFKPRGD